MLSVVSCMKSKVARGKREQGTPRPQRCVNNLQSNEVIEAEKQRMESARD